MRIISELFNPSRLYAAGGLDNTNNSGSPANSEIAGACRSHRRSVCGPSSEASSSLPPIETPEQQESARGSQSDNVNSAFTP